MLQIFGRPFYKVLFLLPLIFLSENGYAQTIEVGSWLDRLNSVYVKTLDEFIGRFNAEEFHPDIIREDDRDLRARSLLTLFNRYHFHWDDSCTAELLMSFIDTVCWHNINVALEDGGVFAEAQCFFVYKQRKIPINLVFVFEEIGDGFYKWALAGATGLLDPTLLDTSHNGYLNPVQHEVHFSELSVACASDLSRYVSMERSMDQMSFFLGMLKAGMLKFDACSKVLFHFLQVPGYVFIVDMFNRHDDNSGYLIDSLLPMDESSKANYKKHTLGI